MGRRDKATLNREEGMGTEEGGGLELQSRHSVGGRGGTGRDKDVYGKIKMVVFL